MTTAIGGPLFTMLRIPADERAPRAARHHVSESFRVWGIPPNEEARLLILELVTNAAREAHGGYVLVALWSDYTMLRISVWDPSLKEPAVIEHDPEQAATSENGRGLLLVARLSAEWGYYRMPPQVGLGGKVVWCLLALQGMNAAGGVS